MVIIVPLVILTIIGFIIFNISDCWEGLGFMMMGLGICSLFTCLITIPINHIDVKSQIIEYHSVRETLKESRKNESIENAAFSVKIAEKNQWRASIIYYNEIFDLWIPDEVEKLKPIK